MILVSNTNNKFFYDNNINKTIKLCRTSETINKLIQYNLNIYNNNEIFNIIDIEFIFLLLDLNETKLLRKIKINEDDFHILKIYKYNNLSLYNIFEEIYSYDNNICKSYYLIGSFLIFHRENDLPAVIFNNLISLISINKNINSISIMLNIISFALFKLY